MKETFMAGWFSHQKASFFIVLLTEKVYFPLVKND
jgi:hypothetical protein